MSEKLTGKQKKFADWYIILLNGVRAAEKAGYKGDYSTLCVTAWENLRKPKIRKYINKHLEEVTLPSAEVLQRLTQQAQSDLSLFLKVNERGGVSLRPKMIAKYGYLIKSLRETKNGIHITLHDAQNALVHLGKHYELFTDKVKHEHKIDVSQLSDEQLKRIVNGENPLDVIGSKSGS